MRLLPLALFIVLTVPGVPAGPVSIAPATMARLGIVDARFQSYNVEMVEVTGGRFWKPYPEKHREAAKTDAATSGPGGTPAGVNPDLFEYRQPIDMPAMFACSGISSSSRHQT
jgi:hypothetical protein